MFFKIVFGKEIHVMNAKETTSLSELRSFVKGVFKRLPPKYMLSYIDNEGDQITLGNESDVKVLQESGLKSVKLVIEETSEEFFDQTVEVIVEDDEKNVETEVELAKIEEPPSLPIELNESSISNVSNIDESIEEKMKKLLPDLIARVKTEVLNESQIKSVKDEKEEVIEIVEE